MDEDDRMVASVLMVRARRVSNLALFVGGGAALLSALPHTGLPLPAKIYGLCTVLPIVGGLAAVPGALLGLRSFQGQPPGVMEALRARGMVTVGLRAGAGAALGVLAILSGVLALLWMQMA
jgi:hypothetical protein